jgi:hypothetical protein
LSLTTAAQRLGVLESKHIGKIFALKRNGNKRWLEKMPQLEVFPEYK